MFALEGGVHWVGAGPFFFFFCFVSSCSSLALPKGLI